MTLLLFRLLVGFPFLVPTRTTFLLPLILLMAHPVTTAEELRRNLVAITMNRSLNVVCSGQKLLSKSFVSCQTIVSITIHSLCRVSDWGWIELILVAIVVNT